MNYLNWATRRSGVVYCDILLVQCCFSEKCVLYVRLYTLCTLLIIMHNIDWSNLQNLQQNAKKTETPKAVLLCFFKMYFIINIFNFLWFKRLCTCLRGVFCVDPLNKQHHRDSLPAKPSVAFWPNIDLSFLNISEAQLKVYGEKKQHKI